MKYKVESNESGINIEISESKGKKEELLEVFRKCQEGRCSCPTQEYSKLDSLEIESNEDSIHLKLKSKSNEHLDDKEITKCLEYTKAMLQVEK